MHVLHIHVLCACAVYAYIVGVDLVWWEVHSCMYAVCACVLYAFKGMRCIHQYLLGVLNRCAMFLYVHKSICDAHICVAIHVICARVLLVLFNLTPSSCRTWCLRQHGHASKRIQR